MAEKGGTSFLKQLRRAFWSCGRRLRLSFDYISGHPMAGAERVTVLLLKVASVDTETLADANLGVFPIPEVFRTWV